MDCSHRTTSAECTWCAIEAQHPAAAAMARARRVERKVSAAGPLMFALLIAALGVVGFVWL